MDEKREALNVASTFPGAREHTQVHAHMCRLLNDGKDFGKAVTAVARGALSPIYNLFWVKS